MKNQSLILRAFFLGLMLVLVLLASREAAANTFSKSEIEEMIIQEAEYQGFDSNLALAIAKVESNLNPKAVGRMGEIGLFQLRPEYHDVRIGQVRHNVRVAISYLVKLQNQCRSYGRAFYICYNLGPNYRRKDGLPLKYPRSFAYYKRVEHARRQILFANN
jgi:soluble lytic murein transglycosylase-like protein